MLGALIAGKPGYLVVGVLMMVPLVRDVVRRRQAHQRDLVDASVLTTALRSGQVPEPIPPERLQAAGEQLDGDEVCYIDGAPVEVVYFYGEAVVRKRGFILAWGSPLAWAFSILGTLFMQDRARKMEQEAGPQWRDPEHGQLWMTSRRYILYGVGGNRNWIHLPWERIADLSLDDDGLALTLADNPETPMKLRVPNPVWHYVLFRHLADHVIPDVPAPRASMLASG